MSEFIVHGLNSLYYASILFLLACGLSLIYGVMRIVNMAHGTLYALGAYACAGAVLALGPEYPLLSYLLIPVGAVAAGLTGALIEPILLRPLYRRPEEYQLLVTFGLLLILEDVMRFFWGALPLSPSVPADFLGSITILEATYPSYNFLVIAIGAAAALALWAFIYKTKFGILLRATSQDMRMTSALGVNVRRVYVLAFTLGCSLAGLGGATIVPISGAALGMGVDALIVAFVVVVVGGLGSLEGAMVGALIVGVFRTLGVNYFPELELAIMYLITAVVLLVRPAGLFGEA
jgi:branched-subunit amino acid ABC-type transport system permease component